MRIYLILCEEEIRGQKAVVVSHGTTIEGKNVILPCEPLDQYKRDGAKFDREEGSWYIEGSEAGHAPTAGGGSAMSPT